MRRAISFLVCVLPRRGRWLAGALLVHCTSPFKSLAARQAHAPHSKHMNGISPRNAPNPAPPKPKPVRHAGARPLFLRLHRFASTPGGCLRPPPLCSSSSLPPLLTHSLPLFSPLRAFVSHSECYTTLNCSCAFASNSNSRRGPQQCTVWMFRQGAGDRSVGGCLPCRSWRCTSWHRHTLPGQQGRAGTKHN